MVRGVGGWVVGWLEVWPAKRWDGWADGRLGVGSAVGPAGGRLGARPAARAAVRLKRRYIAGQSAAASQRQVACGRLGVRLAAGQREVKGAFWIGGLLYESPGGNQVDGLPPVSTYSSN